MEKHLALKVAKSETGKLLNKYKEYDNITIAFV
jgi:hypothetical protein